MITFVPQHISTPPRVLADVPSAWRGLESVLGEIVERFCKGRKIALDCGVEYGVSTVALSNFFDTVIGVDHFLGDRYTANKSDIYQETLNRLSVYSNILLARIRWEDWAAKDCDRYDLIHIDMEHSYDLTFASGLWACEHSSVVMCHDYDSFLTVRQAVNDVALKTGREIYDYPRHCGLAVLV
jgi:hypothetical protein